MDKYIDFGKCLDIILSELNISRSKLSKVVNVDPSLVTKWIKGTRVPPYGSDYTARITDYINSNIINSFQENKINKLLESYLKTEKQQSSRYERIKKLLLEAQGYSLEKKMNKKNKTTIPYIKEGIHKSGYVDETAKSFYNNISSEYKLLIGFDSIFEAALKLLENAANRLSVQNKPILFTCSGHLSLETLQDKFYPDFQKLLSEVLKKGWKISLLYHMDNSPDKNIGIMYMMKDFITNHNFNVYYSQKYDMLTGNTEMFIVPGAGSLLCLSTKQESMVDSAFYFINEQAADILSGRFNQHMVHASPLLNLYSPENNPDFLKLSAEHEENPGNRYHYKECLNSVVLPLNLYEKCVKTIEKNNLNIEKRTMYHMRRLNAFYSQIKTFEYRDIFSKKSIEDMILKRNFPCDDVGLRNNYHMQQADIIKLLEKMVFMLEKYDNYNIALLNKSEQPAELQFFWSVKEKSGILGEINTPPGSLPDHKNLTYFLIKEPNMIKAFEHRFHDIWNNIPTVNKDKKDTILWLKSLIKFIRNLQGN